jgi:cytochrome P450
MIETDLDPFGDDFLADPYPGHEELREAGPVVWLRRYRVYAMARFADVDAALRDPDTFCSSRGVGLTDFATEENWRPPSLLLEADPPEHTGAREAVTAVLTTKAVQAMRASFAQDAAAIIDPLVQAGTFDGVAELAEAFPLKVFPDQVGIPERGREHLLPYGNLAFNAFGPRNRHFERAMAGAAGAQEWITAQTTEVALLAGGLGVQIHASGRERGFGEHERGLLVRSLLTAGVDTTVHGIGNALWCLAEHPDQWAALHADPGLAAAAFEETLRFEAPVQTFFRTTTRPVEVGDCGLPEGAKVLLFLAAANRDPRRFDEPDRFDIRRRKGRHVGFGAGIHTCVGRRLAQLEGEVVLRALAERVEEIAIDGPVQRQLNNTLRGLDRLPLRVVGITRGAAPPPAAR